MLCVSRIYKKVCVRRFKYTHTCLKETCFLARRTQNRDSPRIRHSPVLTSCQNTETHCAHEEEWQRILSTSASQMHLHSWQVSKIIKRGVRKGGEGPNENELDATRTDQIKSKWFFSTQLNILLYDTMRKGRLSRKGRHEGIYNKDTLTQCLNRFKCKHVIQGPDSQKDTINCILKLL